MFNWVLGGTILGSFTGASKLANCQDKEATNSEQNKQAQDRKAVAKAGYLQRRKMNKAQQQAALDKEQSQLLARHLPELKDLLKESDQDLHERKKERQQLRKAYDEHVALRKYKHNVKKRLEQANQNVVAIELNKYAREVLFKKTDDEEVYTYQRKLQRVMQQQMVYKQWLPISLGVGLFKLTRRLKKSAGTDIFYFVVPYLYANYGIFCVEQKTIFEMGYPAHPYIIEQRMSVINKTCFSYPQIVKNEIEYLQTKIEEEHQRKMEQNESTGSNEVEEAAQLKYEKVFTIGDVTSDYKRMLKDQANQQVAETKENEAKKLMKFKIIVEDGELYLQCIDTFEDIFEISRASIENLELTELLDPYMFDSHRDIINALFEVYYSLSQEYLKVCHYEKVGDGQGVSSSSSLADRATKKLRQQYNLDDIEADSADLNETRRVRKTIQEASQKI